MKMRTLAIAALALTAGTADAGDWSHTRAHTSSHTATPIGSRLDGRLHEYAYSADPDQLTAH